MIIKGTKVEVVDATSRLVLKRSFYGDTQVLNRKLAIPNQIYTYERQRLLEDKSVFPNAPYQTEHIFYDKLRGWDYTTLPNERSRRDLLLPRLRDTTL